MLNYSGVYLQTLTIFPGDSFRIAFSQFPPGVTTLRIYDNFSPLFVVSTRFWHCGVCKSHKPYCFHSDI